MGANTSSTDYYDYLDSCEDEEFEMGWEGVEGIVPEEPRKKGKMLRRQTSIHETGDSEARERRRLSRRQKRQTEGKGILSMKSKSGAIDRKLTEQRKAQSKQTDIVLFGRVSSGKSTLLKQLLLATLIDETSCRSSAHYRQALANEKAASSIERNKSDMFKTIFRGLTNILQMTQSMCPEAWDETLDLAKTKFVLLHDYMQKTVDEETAQLARSTWTHSRVQHTFESQRQVLQESRAMDHYMRNPKIFEDSYVMTIKDWLFATGKSNEYETTEITHKDCRFRILEANADNTPNKILAKYFSRAFLAHVVDISEYDEYEFVDGRRVNKLTVSMRFFKRIMEDNRLGIYHCFLVFNKNDRMRSKLSQVPFAIPSGQDGARWSDFSGSSLDGPVSERDIQLKSNTEFERHYEDVITYIKNEFMRQIPGQRDYGCARRVDVFTGSCFDPAMVEALFKSCETAVLQSNLGFAGNAHFLRREADL